MSTKETSYHIAIDGQGYQLAGSPTSPKRTMERSPVFGNRFATGDRDYSDFSLWWYWAQTDWSGGISEDRKWQDNAKFYYTENMDAWSEPGTIKLASGFDVTHDFDLGSNRLLSGVYGSVGGDSYHFVSVVQPTPCLVYQLDGTWSDITGAEISNNVDYIWYLMTHNESLWIFSEDQNADNSDALISWTGSAFTDHAGDIKTAMTWSNLTSAHCGLEVGGALYVSIVDKTTTPWTVGVVYTSDTGANWTKLFELTTNAQITSMATDGTDIYYMLSSDDNHDFYRYDIADDVNVHIQRFFQETITFQFTSFFPNSYLFYLNGNIVIAAEKEVWEYNVSSGTMTLLFRKRDDMSDATNGNHSVLEAGIKQKNKIWWANLMYDGTAFFNTKVASDNDYMLPLYTDGDTIYWRKYSDGRDILYEDNSSFIDDIGRIEFCEIEEVSTIDKLVNAVTLVFDALSASGQAIQIQYSIDGGDNFTTLETIEYDTLGAISERTVLFGDDVLAKKVIIKLLVDGTTSVSPQIKDISLQYLPVPDYKFRWNFILDCNDDLLLHDNKSKEPKKGVDLRHALRTSFLKKEIIELEDIDFAETKINDASPAADDATITVDSTDNFPEKGRLKIEDEEILYTGKTRTTFTGCTRGYRGTNAADHADNDTVSNKYKAIITNYSEQIPIADDYNVGEFYVSVELLEA